MTDPAHQLRTHLFRYGEAYDDLRPAFVIDERGYADAAEAQADVYAAEAALRQTGVIYEIEVSAAESSRGLDGVPGWGEFRRRHFVDGVPLPVRPKPADRSVPPSWHAMNEEMGRAGESLCDELTRANREALPDGDTTVLAHRGPVRHGPASVYLHEERFGFVVAVETELASTAPIEALTSAAGVYEAAGWRLGDVVRDGPVASRHGERGLFRLTMAAEPGFLTVHASSPLYGAPAEPGTTWLTEPRPGNDP
ncbi:MAG TPA: hypothetical protein VF657_15190 [Actinoplanes sp.]